MGGVLFVVGYVLLVEVKVGDGLDFECRKLD